MDTTAEIRRGEGTLHILLALLRTGRLATRDAMKVLGKEGKPGQRAALSGLTRLVDLGVARAVGKGQARAYVLDPLESIQRVTWADRVALRVGRDAVSFLRGTLLADGLDKAVESGPRDTLPYKHLHRKLVHLAEPEPEYEPYQEIIDEVMDSVMRQRALQLCYAGTRGTWEHSDFRPLTLVIYRRALYLLGTTGPGGEVRRLRVERLKSVQLGARFDYPNDWDPHAELAPWFGIFALGTIDRIVLRFSAKVAPHVRARRWHHTARVREFADGSVQLEMETAGPELERFVLEWGQHCVVVAPTDLRDRVIEVHRQALMAYGVFSVAEQVVSDAPRRVSKPSPPEHVAQGRNVPEVAG